MCAALEADIKESNQAQSLQVGTGLQLVSAMAGLIGAIVPGVHWFGCGEGGRCNGGPAH